MTRIVLGAHGLHGHGGGAALLRALLPALAPHLKCAFLDARFDGEGALPGATPVVRVAPAPAARLRAGISIARAGGPGDVLFAFNNAPPLRRSRARTVLCIRSAFLLPGAGTRGWIARERARITFERWLLRLGRAYVDEYWLQTPTMARAFAPTARGRRVRVMPFFDLPLPAPEAPAAGSHRAVRLFYPAAAYAYKNHLALYRALALLAEGGVRPELAVTLPETEHRRLTAEAGTASAVIVNLGPLPRERVLAELARSDALVFPSDTESLGLPLLEARAAGVPILAAERTYVREVCMPAQTFDPQDPRSIVDAVLRFLGRARRLAAPLGAEAFVQAILDCAR